MVHKEVAMGDLNQGNQMGSGPGCHASEPAGLGEGPSAPLRTLALPKGWFSRAVGQEGWCPAGLGMFLRRRA